MQENLAPSYVVANTPLASPSFLDTPLQSSDSAVSIPASETSVSNFEQPNITIIGTAALLCTSKLQGSHNFELCLRSLDIQANSTKLAETPDLSNVPVKFTNSRLSFFSILLFIFIFHSILFFYFLFLEQLGLGLIGHAVTSVTT